MKKRISCLICLAVLIAMGAALAETNALVGQTMPDFTVATTDGDTLTLSELLKAKDVVVLNIFASWCPPCKREFPEMEAVYRDHSDRMEIVAVTGDPSDTMEILADYKAEMGLSFPMGLETGVSDFVQVEGYPTTLVIDRDGRIGYFQLGAFATEALFRGIVEHFLDGNYDGTPAASFNVYVCDQDMEPVPGVIVRFCDTDCRQYTSDGDGIIAFVDQPARYSLQIESVPEGYSFDPSFEAVCDGSGDWTIVQVSKE